MKLIYLMILNFTNGSDCGENETLSKFPKDIFCCEGSKGPDHWLNDAKKVRRLAPNVCMSLGKDKLMPTPRCVCDPDFVHVNGVCRSFDACTEIIEEKSKKSFENLFATNSTKRVKFEKLFTVLFILLKIF